MLDYDNLENSIKTILDERTPIYKMASITIEANNVSKKKIISEIQKNYGQSKKN
jgi:shikimate kinase